MIDPRLQRLKAEMHRWHVGALRRFGNGISPTHQRALEELAEALCAQALGIVRGRLAYALPCGAGKTQAVVALIAAAYRLGLDLTFAVSANTIKALCLIKRDLMNAGVPEGVIGLRHDKNASELTEELEGETVPPEARLDTGDDDRPIMLVSHSRMRGANAALFTQHRGKPRDLMVWDESMFRADAAAIPLKRLRDSAAHFSANAQSAPALAAFVNHFRIKVEAELAAQERGLKPATLDLAVDGIGVHVARAEAMRMLSSDSSTEQGAATDALALLRLVELPVSVARTGRGDDAVIHHKIAVDPALSNIAVLDASHTVRLLTRQGSVKDGTTKAMRECKRFDRVRVRQYRVAAGKSTLRDPRSAKKVALLAAEVIHTMPSHEAALVVTSKEWAAKLRQLLRSEGIDLDTLIGGKPRVSILTWGRETSTNAYGHCKHVILAGVLRLPRSVVAAKLAGERDDPLYRATQEELDLVFRSEQAHCVLQAMQRGACRTVDDLGMAGGMTLYVLDREIGLRDLLLESLPSIDWQIDEPGKIESATFRAQQAIYRYLNELPASVSHKSVKDLKREVAAVSGIKLGAAAWTIAITSALESLSLLSGALGKDAWCRRGRSVCRDRQVLINVTSEGPPDSRGTS